MKVGTGEGGTQIGQVYQQNPTLFLHAHGCITFVRHSAGATLAGVTAEQEEHEHGSLVIASDYLETVRQLGLPSVLSALS
jgi:hypothetical protein